VASYAEPMMAMIFFCLKIQVYVGYLKKDSESDGKFTKFSFLLTFLILATSIFIQLLGCPGY
jgi:hypothetical protein